MSTTLLGCTFLFAIVGLTRLARQRHWPPEVFAISIGLVFVVESILYGYDGMSGLPFGLQMINSILPASGAFTIGSAIGGIFAVVIRKIWDDNRLYDSGSHFGASRKPTARVFFITLAIVAILWLLGSYLYGIWVGNEVTAIIYPTPTRIASQTETPTPNTSIRSMGERNEQDEQSLLKALDAARKLAAGDKAIEPLIAHVKQVTAYRNTDFGTIIVTTDVKADAPELGGVAQICFMIVGAAIDNNSSLQAYSVVAVDFLEGTNVSRVSAELENIRKVNKQTITWKQFIDNYAHFGNIP